MLIEDIDQTASNVPVTELYNPGIITVDVNKEATRYKYKWRQGQLDALLLNKNSDTLIVSFHGALDRKTTKLPHFERLRTLKETEYSSLFLGDPTLFLGEDFSLGWFTGWSAVNMHKLIARWIVQIADQLNIKHVILSGSSGGGFAAMQVSSYIPNSVALTFNAQTEINEYRINGTSFGAQSAYVRHVRPDLWAKMSEADRNVARINWDSEYDDRVSVVKRYSKPMQNFLLLVENNEEFHYKDHYLPLINILQENQHKGRYRCHNYYGGAAHNPPTLAIFQKYLQEAVEWSRSLPPVAYYLLDKNEENSWFDLMLDRINQQDATFDARLNNKLFFAEFARINEIPVASIVDILTMDCGDFTLPDIHSMVIKPVDASSSQGVLILEKDVHGNYQDLRTGKSYQVNEIKEYYIQFFRERKNCSQKLIIQNRIYDRGVYPIPRDFKLYVFDGKVGLIQCIDRNRSPVAVTWFNEEFEHLSSEHITVNPRYQSRVGFAKPEGHQGLIDLAEKVARLVGTPFLRVDLYLTPKGAVCGEVTFTPGGPFFELTDIFSDDLQFRMGKAWATSTPLELK